MPHISKGAFLNALACPMLAWLEFREEGGPPSLGDRLRMVEGLEVHRRARALLPDAVRVREAKMPAAAERTRQLMSDPATTAILEAAFLVDGYATRADIITRADGGWRMTEIKSGVNDDNPEYEDDVAYTSMVMTRAGTRPVGVVLRLLSRDYRLGMDDSVLFADYDKTDTALRRSVEFADHWDTVRDTTLGDTRPAPVLKGACRGCPCFDTCFPSLANPVTELYRMRSSRIEELVAGGHLSIEDVPETVELNEVQQRIRRAVLSRESQYGAQLAADLATISWPAHYLDFETMKTAIPLFEGVAPHEMMPTQYSLHLASGPGLVTEHREFIAEPTSDPRRVLAERLLEDLGEDGSIITYSSFERRVLNDLARGFPDLAERLEAAVERIVDLLVIISRSYYHPEFHGSFSIKRVLPVLVPTMSYDDLEIGEGDTASTVFTRAAMGEFKADEWATHRENLLAYCRQDTLAMVRLHERLSGMVS